MIDIDAILEELGPFRDSAGENVLIEPLGWRVKSLRTSTDLPFSFASLREADPDDVVAVIEFIRHLIMTRSASYAHNCLIQLALFLRSRVYRKAQEHMTAIRSWKTYLRKWGQEPNLHFVRLWWVWSYDQGLEGFDDADTRWYLLDLVIPGNPKGVAVLTNDPEDGPMFDSEEVAVRAALHRKMEELTTANLALAWLFLSHGPNPMNIALLREDDFRCYEVAGQWFYELKMPRIKKRTPHRSDFKVRKLDPFLGELLRKLIQENKLRYRLRNGPRPLFWSEVERQTAKHWKDYANHQSSAQIGGRLTRIFNSLGVTSPVHGRLLRLTPRRLRYSFAARLVRQGASMEELVDLLDHSDAQNVLIYFRNRQVQQTIDAAGAQRFGPIANRFMGRLATNESEAGGTSSTRIKTTVNLLDLGTCSKGAVCEKYPPRACYLCPKMIAWKDGAHDRFLEETIAVSRADPRGTVQLDDVILAIGEVVALCKK